MTFKRAIVTAVGPLRILIDGDTEPIPFTPKSLIDPATLTVGDVVHANQSGHRLVVLGRVGGISLLPSGTMVEFAGTTQPSQWLFCNGQSLLRSAYPALFTAIGVVYGAADSTHFNVPDKRGRVSVGFDSTQSEFDTLGEKGGAKTHTLTGGEVPDTRVRTDNSRTNEGWASTGGDYGLGGSGSYRRLLPGSGSDSLRVDGGGGAHNNLQPYISVNHIIKI